MDVASVPVDLWQVVLRLSLAVVLGAAVGLNRELKRQPAGLRTHSLVALGAAVIVIAGMIVSANMGDPSGSNRVIQGVIAGIGFIGGGVIMRREEDRGLHGLTTAASVWVMAGTGVALGMGLWRMAVIATVLVLAILTIGDAIDRRLDRRR